MRNPTTILSLLVAVAGLLPARAAFAKLSVITTTTDLATLAEEVGGDSVSVDAICKGTQDPHYIEAKPSYMVKVSRADLVVSIGLELEVGWLPSILRGARNPKVAQGSEGFLEVGPLVDRLEIAQGKVTRAEGDVHPFGNPHVTLDPIRAGAIALKIAERMGALDRPGAAGYLERAKKLQGRLAAKTREWAARLEKAKVTKIISYHKTLTYFFDRFGIANPAILEPKPGIPPTAKHILEVIALAKEQGIRLVMVENFFDPTVAERVAKDVEGLRTRTVPVAVGGDPSIKSLDDLYERLVAIAEGKP